MFFTYYVWFFFNWFFFKFSNQIKFFFIKYNHLFYFVKKNNYKTSFFEKIFFIFFKDTAFYKNNEEQKNLINYRSNFYPTFSYYNLYNDKTHFNFVDLNIFIKQCDFFNKSRFFNYNDKIFPYFFLKNKNYHFFLKNLIFQKLIFKKYLNLLNSVFYKVFSISTPLKLNFLFNVFIMKGGEKHLNFNLSKYEDWYLYHFSIKINKLFFKNLLLSEHLSLNLKFKQQKFFFLNTIYTTYKNNHTNIYFYKPNFISFLNLNINDHWYSNLKKKYSIKFNNSSITKYILFKKLKNYNFFFLRKVRIFNKSRYSRNRQLYRTGVYWCLWVNIVIVYGLYFLFYRFSFNFGYIWWGLLILLYSTIFSRVLKYNFFNVKYIFNEFYFFIKWLGLIIINLKLVFFFFLKFFLNRWGIFDLISKKFFFNVFLKNFTIKILYFYSKIFSFKDSQKYIYFWESLNEKDTSFFKYKTFFHWVKQLYKILLT